MRNIKLEITYDGTRYKGWQSQTNTDNTIQGILTKELSALCKEPIELIGSGRTDVGVHAYSQIANFHTNSGVALNELKKAVNDKLNNDICITKLNEADPRFHARYNAVGKKYRYRIWNHEEINVFERKYSYHLPTALNINKINEAAKYLLGTHNFKGFSSDKRTKKSTIKTLYIVEVTNHEGMTEFLFHGNAFLYNMVRIMSGTLIEIGLGLKPVSVVPEILESKDRSKAGFTAPPQGLFLQEVLYSEID